MSSCAFANKNGLKISVRLLPSHNMIRKQFRNRFGGRELSHDVWTYLS